MFGRRFTLWGWLPAFLLMSLVMTSCGETANKAEAPSTTTPYAGYRSAVYANPASWLCRPDIAGNPCTRSLDATVITGDGSTRADPFTLAGRRPIDCFYVYGMISTDPPPNADMNPAANEEVAAIRTWPAQLSRDCNVYAPIYRQIPLSAFGTRVNFTSGPDGAIAYGDVLDSWKQYMANYNHGRGVMVIGDSEGSSLLLKLIADEIDPNPAMRAKLVAAYLIGWPVTVPKGRNVGGSFAHIPICRSYGQTGCVMSWSSYLAGEPPGPDSRYGRPRSGTGDAICTNPAALRGGEAPLDSWFRVTGAEPTTANPFMPTTAGFADPSGPLPTAYVELPGLARGQCIHRNGFSYLKVTVEPSSNDPRIHSIPGDLGPRFGLHLIDANLVLGNMLDLIRSQTAAFRAAG